MVVDTSTCVLQIRTAVWNMLKCCCADILLIGAGVVVVLICTGVRTLLLMVFGMCVVL